MNTTIFDKIPLPHPYNVKDQIENGFRLPFDLHDELDYIFPVRPLKKKYKVLIVGCGHNEAIYHSLRNPNFKFTAIDHSSLAIDSNLKQIKEYRLKNLVVHNIDLFDFNESSFDIIIIMDFISYHKEPENVLKHISSLLSDDGVILGNVLSSLYFQQVNIMREVFINLGYSYDSDEDIDEAFELVKSLDNLHPSRIALLDFLKNQADPNSFIDLRDFILRFINNSLHYYSVNQLFEFFNSCNLYFQNWYSNSLYYPSANFREGFMPTFVEKLSKKSLPEQWDAVCSINGPYIHHHKHLFCISKSASSLFLASNLMNKNDSLLKLRHYQSYKKSKGVGTSFVLSSNRKTMLNDDEDTIYCLLETPKTIDYILHSDDIDLTVDKRKKIINKFFEASLLFPLKA